jgi:hypothetical protein
MSTLNVASINGGPIGGSRNALINGNPTINQRGYVSGTATSGANQYTLDRWRVVTSGQSITWTDSANVRTVTAPAGGVEQVIEGVNLGTGTYTLSWTGTATATVGGTAVANGTTVSVTGGVDLTVRFIGGTFSLAQFEPGTRSTIFERRSYGQELALCQRYYQSVSGDFAGYLIQNDAIFWGIPFAVSMRAAPTVTFSGYTFVPATTNLSANTVSTSGFTVQLAAGASGTTPAAGRHYGVGGKYTASIEL